MFQELTADTLATFVAENPKVLVQFSASWCGNCRIMKPKLTICPPLLPLKTALW
jgi:thiol-disulfide isomerase/thioredoxin